MNTNKVNPQEIKDAVIGTGLSCKEFAHKANIAYDTLLRVCRDPNNKQKKWVMESIYRVLELENIPSPIDKKRLTLREILGDDLYLTRMAKRA